MVKRSGVAFVLAVSLGLVACGGHSSSRSASVAATGSTSAPATSAAGSAAPAGGGSGGTSSVASSAPVSAPLAPPAISALTPASGWNDRDTPLVIEGTGFLPGSVVRLSGTAGVHTATQVAVLSEFRIQAVAPAGLPAGSYTVEVEHAGGVSPAGPSLDLANLLDVDQPGALAVGYRDQTMRGAAGDTVVVRYYYPALSAGRNAAPDPAAGPYPVVVYGHGFRPPLLAAGIDLRNNTFLAEFLASYGYLVVCPDLATNNVYFGANGRGQANSERDADDLQAALEFMTGLGQDAAHMLFGLVDGARAALVGHSRGADGALMAAAEEVLLRGAQSRVKALAVMAPPATDSRNNNAPLQFGDFSAVPTLLIGASEDRIAPLSDQQAILALAGSPSWLFEIVGGNHSQYKDSDRRILGDGTASLPLAEQQAICQRYVGAWLQRHVKGLDVPAVTDRILTGAEVARDGRIRGSTVR